MRHFLQCGAYRLSLKRPLIMGIVNVTPDSFSDGGQHFSAQQAIAHGLRLIDEGADILDIGGESTRPGATPVSEHDELERILPVLEDLADKGIPLSVDTSKTDVMRRAIAAGASMINDINALQSPEALELLAASDAAVCLMHKQGDPQSMQQNPRYEDVLAEVTTFLVQRVAAARNSGIPNDRIVIDPGIGFGKNFDHNMILLRQLDHFKIIDMPLLVGLSRKAFLGIITGQKVGERIHASVAAALYAAKKGAAILRVHDVQATKDALAVMTLLEEN